MTLLEFVLLVNQFLQQVFREQKHLDNGFVQILFPGYQFDHWWTKYDFVEAYASIVNEPDRHRFQLLSLYLSFHPRQNHPHLNVGFQFLKQNKKKRI